MANTHFFSKSGLHIAFILYRRVGGFILQKNKFTHVFTTIVMSYSVAQINARFKDRLTDGPSERQTYRRTDGQKHQISELRRKKIYFFAFRSRKKKSN